MVWVPANATKTRSGATFSPYDLSLVELQAPLDVTLVNTGFSIRDLLEASMGAAQEHDELVGDDCDGAALSSRPCSPLPDLTESEGEESLPPPPQLPQPSMSALNTATPAIGIEKQRKKIATARRRKGRRGKAAAQAQNTAHDYRLKPSHSQKYREHATQSIKFNVKSLAASAAAGAWIGKRAPGKKQSPWKLDELLERGFRIIYWDGMYVSPPFVPFTLLTTLIQQPHATRRQRPQRHRHSRWSAR